MSVMMGGGCYCHPLISYRIVLLYDINAPQDAHLAERKFIAAQSARARKCQQADTFNEKGEAADGVYRQELPAGRRQK